MRRLTAFPLIRLLGILALAAITSSSSSCKKDDPSGDFATTGYPTGNREEPANAQSRPIVIGDQLEVFVQEEPSFNDIYVVREAGDIIIPKLGRLGRIQVAGLSVKATEARIASALKAGQQIEGATVIVDRLLNERGQKTAQQSIRIFLTGKVVSPGMHRIPIDPGQEVGAYEALLIAGGMTRFGDERTTHILRSQPGGKRAKLPLDIRGINQGSASDVRVAEGDIIVVPEKVFGF